MLTTKDYFILPQVLFLICLNIAIFGFYQFTYNIILLERGSFNAPIIMLFVTGINIFINYILIPKIGILGSALASFFQFLASNNFL